MIPPGNRHLFLELLEPPDGWQLDIAAGTTFSLDLEALLMLPLAFLRQSGTLEDAGIQTDPVALLAALRRHSDRLTVFCQAGQTRVPGNFPRLAALLEPCVIECLARDPQGSFHPKVWVLRFTPLEDGERVKYRILCLSRNLTFDRSWDTVVALDGEWQDHLKRPFPQTRPLVEFLRVLPALACRTLDPGRQAQLDQMAEELQCVKLEAPDGFEPDETVFWHGGLESSRTPFTEHADRALVVSPFLSASWLAAFRKNCGDLTLVSRLEALDALPAEQCSGCRVLSRAISSDDEDAEPETLRGLHAKMFILDHGWDTRVLTGSFNATTAAFTRNVEFMIELWAKRQKRGVARWLERAEKGDAPAFADLLEDYVRADGVGPVEDPEAAWDQRCLEMRRLVAEARFSVTLTPLVGGSYRAELRATGDFSLPPGISLAVWPGAVSQAHQQRLLPGQDAVFASLSFESVTGWFVFKLSEGPRSASWLANLPLINAPENRTGRLLAACLENPAALVRLLRLTLAADASTGGLSTLAAALRAEETGARHSSAQPPLLETLLEAAHRQPSSLDRLHRIFEDLRSSGGAQALITGELEEIWNPVWEACRA